MCVCVVCFLFYINKKSFLYTNSKNHARPAISLCTSVNRGRFGKLWWWLLSIVFHTFFLTKDRSFHKPIGLHWWVAGKFLKDVFFLFSKFLFLYCSVRASSVNHAVSDLFTFVLACVCLRACIFFFFRFRLVQEIIILWLPRSYRDKERKSFRSGRGKRKDVMEKRKENN